jgi:hypothetical protein
MMLVVAKNMGFPLIDLRWKGFSVVRNTVDIEPT